jgi:hypothetical protein
MTESPFHTAPEPAKIFCEACDLWTVKLTIDTSEETTEILLDLADAYSIARYLEWLAEPGACASPSNGCPDGVGVWGENTDTGRLAHVVILGDDDDESYGTAIALDMSRASKLSDQLFQAAIKATLDYEEEEEDE